LLRASHQLAVCLLLCILAGCGGSTTTTTPPPPAIGQIYVAKGIGNPIANFRAGDNGDIAPRQEINILANSLAKPTTLCIDVPHNRLAGTSNDGIPIVVLIDNASGLSTPPRLITGAATTMRGPGGCALDGTTDLLYVSDTGSIAGASSILVFGPASTVSDNISPRHTILVPSSGAAIAVDPANDRLFVTDATNNAIQVYDSASTLDGAVTPSRTISGPLTQLSQLGSLAFESTGHLVVGSAFFNNASAVRVFANAGSLNGNVAPSAVFSLSTGTMSQISVTPAGELYVVGFSPQIVVFSNVFNATGTLNPVRVIAGPHTDLDSNIPGAPPLVSGIAVDPTR